MKLISYIAVLAVILGNYYIPRKPRLSIILYMISSLGYMILLKDNIEQVVLSIYLIIQSIYNLTRRNIIKTGDGK